MTKMERIISKGAQEGIECLREICSDPEQKAADRIAAAKALYEFARKADTRETGAVSVILENVPKEFLV